LDAGRVPAPLTAFEEPEVARLTADELADPVHPYIRIRQDETIVVFCSQLEMGQGAHTRQAAAQARARLVAAAAETWRIPAAGVEVTRGVLRDGNGRQATFGELAVAAERMPVPEHVGLKDPADYTLIGRVGLLRVDAAAKILGRTRFTIDRVLPGMVTAVVLHPPRFGATVASVDDEAALAESGVIAAVEIDEGVAVVGETFADAQRGLRALTVEWDDTNIERRSSDELLDEHLRLLESGERAVVSRDDGDVDQAFAQAQTTVDATYTVPYLAHAAMEPNNAVCQLRGDGKLDVWASTESPEYTRMAASEAGGIDKARIEVHVTYAGGSFGLHSTSTHDPTTEAVHVARALAFKHPVKVQSLREEDFKTGRYRAMAARR
jgi:isoquinoline 1-oxidoreductase beta subunit